jgi:hypothetical protein
LWNSKCALAAKKSVRALFDSKTKPKFDSKSNLTPQKRLLVLGSSAALATVVIIGSWVVLSMISGTGNQYVIAPLSDNVPLGAPITIPETASTPISTADSAAPPATVAATDTAVLDTRALAETVAATATPTQAETVAATDTPAADATAVEPESATAIVETSVSTPVASPSAPATTAPVVAQTTPSIDPETGLYELPLDADQSRTGPATAGSPSPIRISRSEPMRNPDMQLLNAWSAYQQGDYAAARILYQQFLLTLLLLKVIDFDIIQSFQVKHQQF